MSKQKVRVVMWSVLSCDYDERATPELCLRLTMPNIRPGSIVVFHDSAKAFDKMSFVLPRLMKAFTDKGYSFEKLE
jgi:hypothetical protein